MSNSKDRRVHLGDEWVNILFVSAYTDIDVAPVPVPAC